MFKEIISPPKTYITQVIDITTLTPGEDTDFKALVNLRQNELKISLK